MNCITRQEQGLQREAKLITVCTGLQKAVMTFTVTQLHLLAVVLTHQIKLSYTYMYRYIPFHAVI